LVDLGDVVTQMGVGRWDVGIKDELIAFVGLRERSGEASRDIDAARKIVDRSARCPASSTPPGRLRIVRARWLVSSMPPAGSMIARREMAGLWWCTPLGVGFGQLLKRWLQRFR
jgi:hypothetical protein